MKSNFVYVFFFTLVLFSCKKDPAVEPTDDNELITTVELEFTNSKNVTKTFSFQDLDANSITPPDKFESIVLDANENYDMEVKVYDESRKPRVDVTEKIEEDAEAHLFVYKVTPASLFSLKAKDKDKNNLPVGLKNTGKTQGKGVGKLHVILKHQPPANGKRTKNGDEEIGSTDIDLEFKLEIK
ncbi:hypothetical protein [Aquirufa aurantiipilula]|uniref:Type 1 periplasmic binding fold superfamily protein n=1 Tax=Aquirufa aurantiipilula TaxID=2696561 RepID=A0ABT6BKL5_9BACT|nr:hypothetical protein [Aquirufa aurantiipilula]MBZ1326195.1 hypothetical protein [Aquirufa aurantiipilula]MDF5690701.1 hypothetical protein [Aquirufa aurantiipilula]